MRWPSRPMLVDVMFTLVEMMIVVGIVAVLAAIAVPLVMDFQTRAKEAEVPPNVDGIRTAMVAYSSAFGDLPWASLTLIAVPDASPGEQKRSWVSGTEFDTISWKPDGDVRGSYTFQDAPAPYDFVATGEADPDNDGDLFVCTSTTTTFICDYFTPPLGDTGAVDTGLTGNKHCNSECCCRCSDDMCPGGGAYGPCF